MRPAPAPGRVARVDRTPHRTAVTNASRDIAASIADSTTTDTATTTRPRRVNRSGGRDLTATPGPAPGRVRRVGNGMITAPDGGGTDPRRENPGTTDMRTPVLPDLVGATRGDSNTRSIMREKLYQEPDRKSTSRPRVFEQMFERHQQ